MFPIRYVSWYASNTNPNISTSFMLTVVTVMGTIYTEEMLDTFHIYMPTSSPCEEFEIQIAARIDAWGE